MGSLDANGIWIYDDNDHVIPISAYENLGQTSVSNALADFRDDVEAEFTVVNTGWVDISLNAAAAVAVSGYTPQIKRYGDVVSIRGRVTRFSGNWPSGMSMIGTLPTIPGVVLTPGQTHECGTVMYGTSSSAGRLIITTDGQIQGFNLTGATSGSAVYLSGTPWMVN